MTLREGLPKKCYKQMGHLLRETSLSLLPGMGGLPK